MTLDELIEKLNLIKAHSQNGQMQVYWESISHLNTPDLAIRKTDGGKEYLLLNS